LRAEGAAISGKVKMQNDRAKMKNSQYKAEGWQLKQQKLFLCPDDEPVQ
jgi:hypothetical protein